MNTEKDDKWLILKVSIGVIIFTSFLLYFYIKDFINFQEKKEVRVVLLKKDFTYTADQYATMDVLYKNKKYNVVSHNNDLKVLNIGDTINVYYSEKGGRFWPKGWNITYNFYGCGIFYIVSLYGIFYNIYINRK